MRKITLFLSNWINFPVLKCVLVNVAVLFIVPKISSHLLVLSKIAPPKFPFFSSNRFFSFLDVRSRSDNHTDWRIYLFDASIFNLLHDYSMKITSIGEFICLIDFRWIFCCRQNLPTKLSRLQNQSPVHSQCRFLTLSWKPCVSFWHHSIFMCYD